MGRGIKKKFRYQIINPMMGLFERELTSGIALMYIRSYRKEDLSHWFLLQPVGLFDWLLLL